MLFLFVFTGSCPPSVDGCSDAEIDVTEEDTMLYLHKCQASKPPLITLIQSHSLAPTLIYCIRTTTIQLLHVAVVEPIPLHDLSLPR